MIALSLFYCAVAALFFASAIHAETGEPVLDVVTSALWPLTLIFVAAIALGDFIGGRK